MVLLPSFYKFLERMRVAFSQFPVFLKIWDKSQTKKAKTRETGKKQRAFVLRIYRT
eukprot:COSAG02_NODE_72042_length_188_cov_28.955056_1_plen_55_part_01